MVRHCCSKCGRYMEQIPPYTNSIFEIGIWSTKRETPPYTNSRYEIGETPPYTSSTFEQKSRFSWPLLAIVAQSAVGIWSTKRETPPYTSSTFEQKSRFVSKTVVRETPYKFLTFLISPHRVCTCVCRMPGIRQIWSFTYNGFRYCCL